MDIEEDKKKKLSNIGQAVWQQTTKLFIIR